MNISIVNQPLGNRGDEAAHKGLVRELNKRFPNAQVHIFSPNGNKRILNEISVRANQNTYISDRYSHRLYKRFIRLACKFPSLYKLLNLQPILKAWIKELQWTDIVICAPGGICMGGFMNWGHVVNLLIAKYYKKPVVYFCRSIGPLCDETKDKRLFKRSSIRLLKTLDYISLRDEKSQHLARELGIKFNSTTDAAFLDNTLVDIPDEIKKRLDGKRYVVFVPNSLTWHYFYKSTPQANIDKFYLNIFSHLEKNYPNMKIVMLPQTFLNPTWGNDVDYFRELHRQHPSKNIYVIDDIYGSDIQQAIINKACLVIGARYHSVIFAINQARPFCALSYEHKIEGLLQLLGHTEHMVDIRNIFANEQSIAQATAQTISIIDNSMQGKMDLQTLRAKAKSIANRQFDKIEKLIANLKQ